MLSRWDYAIRGLAIAIPFIISAILLKKLFSTPEETSDNQIVVKSFDLPLKKIFIILYIFSLVALITGVERQWYLALIILVYITIVAQIFSNRFNANLIIIEIILTMINIIYGITFSYPLYFHSTDVMVHIFLANVTALSGHIIPLDLDQSYSPFPLYHILISACSNIFNLPVQETLFLVTCPVFVLEILFLFKIFSFLTNNLQVSTLGCVFFSMNEIVLNRGIEMVTNVTASIGFVILIYLLLKASERSEQRQVFQILAIVISLFIILVHQVSIFLIVSLLVLLIVSENIFNYKKVFSNYLVVLIIATLSGYWIYFSTSFLSEIIRSRLETDVMNLNVKHTVLSDPSMNQNTVAIIFLYNNISISIVAIFAITGIFYMLWRQKPKYLAVFGMFLLFTLALYLPNPLSTTELFAVLFRIDRYLILLSPFMAFAMGYGYILAYNNLSKRSSKKIITNLIFISAFLIYMVSSIQGVILTESTDTRLFFNSQELDGFDFVLNNVPYGSDVISEYYSMRFFTYPYFSLTNVLHLPHFNNRWLEDFEEMPDGIGYFIIREKMFEEDGLFIGREGTEYIYLPTEENRINIYKYICNSNKIYDSDSIAVVH